MSKDKKFPTEINGILFKTEEEYNDRLQFGIDAFAKLLFDIHQDKKRLEKQNNPKD